MQAKFFEFHITDFEEVYVVIDNERQRLHISPVNYSFNITLDLTKNLKEEIALNTKFGEMSFNETVRRVAKKVIEKLNLA